MQGPGLHGSSPMNPTDCAQARLVLASAATSMPWRKITEAAATADKICVCILDAIVSSNCSMPTP
jgi:hypothetical protein